MKTKSLKNIESAMEELDASSMRHKVLQAAKDFKTSWIDLGQALYSVWKDKLYKNWGYAQFDTYTAKEIGIKKPTALKLLRSYYFLEREEPRYLRREYNAEADTNTLPSYEAIDLLRRAGAKKTIDKEDYNRIKTNIFERGKDARDVKKDLTSLIREREELEPEEARKKKRTALIKRFLGSLKAIKTEVAISKMLPMQIIKDADKLIAKLESELK